MVGSQSSPQKVRPRFAPAAIHTSQRSPVRVRNGTVNAAWPSWVLTGTGETVRFAVAAGLSIASRAADSAPSVGDS